MFVSLKKKCLDNWTIVTRTFFITKGKIFSCYICRQRRRMSVMFVSRLAITQCSLLHLTVGLWRLIEISLLKSWDFRSNLARVRQKQKCKYVKISTRSTVYIYVVINSRAMWFSKPIMLLWPSNTSIPVRMNYPKQWPINTGGNKPVYSNHFLRSRHMAVPLGDCSISWKQYLLVVVSIFEICNKLSDLTSCPDFGVSVTQKCYLK